NRGGMHAMLTCYAVIAAITALLAILLTREHPPLPPGPVPEREQVSLRSMIGLLGNGAFVQILVLMFISLGVFNTLLTEVDGILTPRGLSTGQADAAGAVFVVAGIAGAVILPAISDRMRRRMPLLSVGMVLMTVFYLLLTFAHGAVLITVITGLAGLTIMGLAPIVFQHSAETAYPVGEGSSFGLLFLMGQVSGALFIFLYEWVVRHTGSVLAPMLIFVVLTAIQVPIAFHMKESRVLLAAQGAAHA
ncbi:MAG: MFS transporter, partial [Propionibacteriaceae bacterium]|nr:MFS transporter [Propionibacteriaceae bacterium]